MYEKELVVHSRTVFILIKHRKNAQCQHMEVQVVISVSPKGV